MKQLITRTIYNFKFLLTAEMMLSILEQFGWALQHPNQQELFSILVQNTLQSLPYFVMMKQQETISLRSMILFKVVSSKEIKCTEDAKPWLTTCTSQNQTKSFQKQAQNWPTVQPNFKVSFGKITLASKPLKAELNQVFNWNLNLNKTNVHSSNFWVCINHKVSVMTLMVFSDFHHTKTWKRRSFIIYGHSKIMELSIEPWLVSVLHQKKWVKHHTHFLEGIIQPKLLEEPLVSKHSKTFKTGLVHGLLKGKVCFMELSQCKNLAKTPNIQLSLTLVALSFPSHQMFSKKLDKNGQQLCQTSIARVIRHFVMWRTVVIMLRQKWNQSDSKWATTCSKSTQSNIFINQAIRNVTLLFTSADFQERIRICSSLVTLSLSISTLCMTLTETQFHLVSICTPREKLACINQEQDQKISQVYRH